MSNHYNRGWGGQDDTSQTQRERDAYNHGKLERERQNRYFQQMANLQRDGQRPRAAGVAAHELLSALPVLAAAAAFFYVWLYFDNLFLGAVGAAVAWRFAESKLGQGLLKLLLALAGLGLAWFFIELSKTFR